MLNYTCDGFAAAVWAVVDINTSGRPTGHVSYVRTLVVPVLISYSSYGQTLLIVAISWPYCPEDPDTISSSRNSVPISIDVAFEPKIS